MFTIEMITARFVYIRSDESFRIVAVGTFKRARGRVERGSVIQEPIDEVIDGKQYRFTKNEWSEAKKKARRYKAFCSSVPGSDKLEISEKVKICKRLAKQRAARLKLEADAKGCTSIQKKNVDRKFLA